MGPQVAPLHFMLLVLSTLLIAGAGNIINDYFDQRIDRINRPDTVIVGRTVKRRVAMAAHIVLSSLGLLLGWWVAWRQGLWYMALLPPFAIGALWTYSTTFKRRFLIGNGLVALLTALVPLQTGLYEIIALQRALPADLAQLMHDQDTYRLFFNTLWTAIIAYTGFAFLATLVRELQKDMADVQGDKAEGCRTVPIVMGMGWSKGLVLAYTALMILGILVVRQTYLDDRLSFWYINLAIVAPLLVSAGLTYQAHTRREHLLAGNLLKVAMVMAVGYAWLIRYTL
ncbi:MAG: geranylgeranylglycerol-phosphate geranylgeranyltransferase [Flavobacteriales bacterium]|nr:geranylgeranylglycerol-phosphate geranylgeranyltransferase [Flavobacteriales bacterium]